MFYQNSTNSPYGWVAGGLPANGTVSSDFNADNVTENSVYILWGNGSGVPSKTGILITIRATPTGTYAYWGLQLFIHAGTKKIYLRFGINGQSAYGNGLKAYNK